MSAGPHHEIAGLRCEPGELSFTARIGGVEQRVWLRTESDVSPGAEAALCACLLPAMRFGGALELPAAVSPRLLRNQREFQALQEAWSRGWEFDGFRLSEVDVRAPAREIETGAPNGRVAALFSGGVDSWSVVLDEPDLTDLIFVRGIDLIPCIPGNVQVADEVEARLRGAAGDLGLAFHAVETNLRELSDPLAPWETYYGCAVASVALFLAPLFERVLIAGDSDYEVQVDYGANRLVDQLWSTEDLEIVDAGGRRSRIERLARIVDNPVVQRTLRTCWQNLGGAYNCGRCRKCLMTMVSLEALGARERVSTFPTELDLDAVAALEVSLPVSLCLWEDILDATRAAGRPDLERAVEPVVASGKRALALPLSYRRRARPGPPPTEQSAAIAQPALPATRALFATPEAAGEIAEAPAIAFLVGSYDGSGNFGDMAQLDAALELLGHLEHKPLALPVLERGHRSSHRELVTDFPHRPRRAVYLGPGEDREDGLVPVPVPGELTWAACYLYGGGYLNPRWGERKLAMLGAAEALLAEAGVAAPCRISSGLQVDAAWVAANPAAATALRAFELLGARDRASREALAALGSGAAAIDGGDDAVGAIWPGSRAPEGAGDGGRELRVNVHVAEHEWVTARPEAVPTFLADLLAGLAGRVGRQVVVQPLIAYLDDRVDERQAAGRFADACAARGIDSVEPRLLRPATVAAESARLRRACLTVSCSYHVALTSLLLGVPATLLADNGYYEQKAAGLATDVGLPRTFALDSSADATEAAVPIADAVLGAGGAELRERIVAGVDRARERRGRLEVELLGRIGAASTPGYGRAAEATLAELLSSRSWRMTAPLRRAGALLRRRG